jgi:hypothetical protein
MGVTPWGVDPAIDCPIREFAWNYSQVLQPARGAQLAVFDALQLGVYCNLTRPAGPEAAGLPVWASPREHWTTPVGGFAATFYADPVNGNDANPGTQAAPFATLARALAASRSGPGPVQLVLRAGTFVLSQPLTLTAIDAGLSITNFPGEQPVISGAAPLPPAALSWQPYSVGMSPSLNTTSTVNACISDPGVVVPGECAYAGVQASAAQCQASCVADTACNAWTYFDATTGAFAGGCYYRIDGGWSLTADSGRTSGLKLNVYVADVSAVLPGLAQPVLSMFADGNRIWPARYPSSNPMTTGLYTATTGWVNSAAGYVPPAPQPPATEIHLAEPLRNGTHFPQYQLGIGGAVSQFQPPESFWALAAPPGGGGSTYTIPRGVVYQSSVFSRNVGAWNVSRLLANGAHVFSYHDGHWGAY